MSRTASRPPRAPSRRRKWVGAGVLALALGVPSVAAAATFVGLPSDGSRVDNDPAAGISASRDAGASDVVGGSLTAGAAAVPWTVFEKETSGAQQIFSRAFANGAWATKGAGTVNGASSASPTFSGSLNFDQGQDGEAPSIDFAGAGRTVPWATWYEDSTSPFGRKEIFASRFDKLQNKWVFAGQGRPVTGGPPVLNIRTDKDAENPSVAGGTTVAGGNPGPWIVWEEKGPSKRQIFVVKPIGPGTVACPLGTKPAGGAPVGGFCWQQVGVERSAGEPSVNVDITRNGIEPDIAFTGPSDTVPWVVWYETGTGQFGVRNERVFAAKAVAPGSVSGVVDGGFHWEAFGNKTTAGQVLDTSGTGGPCVDSKAAEDACTLNRSAKADAEDPRVAAGTMTAGNPTVPWVVWTEQFKGSARVFVSRLVGTKFVLANGGKPLQGSDDAMTADITFARHTPFVTWRQKVGKTTRLFIGRFRNAANPTFKLDAKKGIARSKAGLTLDARAPVSSDCTANPFNGDGSSCQGGAAGKPFFLFTDGRSGARRLFGQRLK